MNLLLRCGLRHHARRPLPSLLTLLGIAAGVALLVAMQSAQRTAERAFDLAVATVVGDGTHVVRGGPDGLPVAGYAALQRALGGHGAAPSVRAIARATAHPACSVLRVFGVDPLVDAGVRGWEREAGRHTPLPVNELVTTPGGFVATPALLAELGLARGATLPLRVGGRDVVGTCLGPLDVPERIGKGLADVLLVDLATAQEWTGRLDRIDRVDLKLAPSGAPRGSVDAEQALAAARAAFGPAARIESAGAQQGGLAQLARGFRVNLTALSLLSLLVGAFLVHETMRLSVAARRADFGVLRALGAPGAALFRAVALEALALGVVGSALGALLGAFGADLLLQPIVRTLNDHYATFTLKHVDLDPGLLLAGVALGGVVALLAGLAPAIAAAAVPPRAVLVPLRAPVAAGGVVAGIVRALRWVAPPAALAVALLATVGDRLVQGYLGMLCVVLAAVAAVPPLLRALLAGAGALVQRRGPFSRYAVRSAGAAQAHVALPVAAMALAVATTIGLATLVGSFRASVDGWLGQALPGDVFVSVPGSVDERAQPIAPAAATAMLARPEVAAATRYCRTQLPVQAGVLPQPAEVDVVGVGPTPRWLAAFPLLGAPDATARAALANGAGAWVSEPLAFRRQLRVGAPLRVTTPAGVQVLPIVAIYRDYSNERGEVMVGADWLARHGGTPVTALCFEVRADVAPAAFAQVLRRDVVAASEQALEVYVQEDLRRTSMEIFDRTFAITGVMRLLCLLVAAIGIYAAFGALQYERGPEIGLLRCLGARRSAIAAVVLGQTALLGLCAGLLAWPLGALLGHLLAHVINTISFGWSLADVAVPTAAVVEALALATGAALVAGLPPAWRYARMRPATALREG
ncbi:MAG: FtsX-like permease family protein [Planctomycetes bacterium]|nr:FtsX-like permease family protein [Planctomycetota bacterium]